MLSKISFVAICSAAIFSFTSQSAQALEYPIGKPHRGSGMEIGAVYLQPVTMDPEGMMRPADQSDIHL